MKIRFIAAAAVAALSTGMTSVVAKEIGPLTLDTKLVPYKTQPPVTGKVTGLSYDNTDKVMAQMLALLHEKQPGIAGTFTNMPQTWPQNKRDMVPLTGSVNLMMAKRLPRPEEEAFFKGKTGYNIQIVAIGKSAVWEEDGAHVYGFVVNEKNPLKQLTLDQVDAIFSKNRLRGYKEPITTWGQLGITDPKFANNRIHAYGRDPLGDVSVDFQQLVMGGGEFKDDFYYGVPDLEVATAAVLEDVNGIAFSDPPNFDRPGLRRIAIAEHAGMPYYEGKWDDIANDRYPLIKHEYVYVNRQPGKPLDPVVKEFLKVALSKEGQSILMKERFMPLTAAEVEAELQKLEK